MGNGLPQFGCVGQRAFAHTSTHWNVPGKYLPYGELFFFLLKKEPMVLRELVRFGPSIPVEAVKACALVGLHMMTEEDPWRMDSDSSFSSSSSCENNVGNDALFVIGLHGSGDTIALFLQDWEVAKVALSCHARNCMKSKGDVVGLDSECVLFVKAKEVNDRSF